MNLSPEGESSRDVVEPTQRRRRRVEGGRHHRHVVRVTPEEEAQLLALALRYHVSVPKLLVESALSGGAEAAAVTGAGRDAALTDLFKVHRLLANLANNMNQIARAANVSGETRDELTATLAAVRRVAERVDETIDSLGAGS